MDEYISREALLKRLNECRTNPLFDPEMARMCFAISVFIEAMQAADVQPVKHAYWLGIGKKFSEDWTCSNCMRAKGKDSSTNFCSYCGADMRGDTNG